MNSPSRTIGIEPSWRTYLKAVVFLIPPILVWVGSCIYLFPKAQEIWRDTGFSEGWAIVPLQMALLLTENASFMLVGAIAVLAWLEWRAEAWPRFRRATLGTVAFLLNTTTLVLLTTILTALLMAAPALANVN